MILSGFGSGRSRVQQTITIDAHSTAVLFDNDVDWHEAHKILKVEFPLHIRSSTAQYEVQGGFISRPTHQNTTVEEAMFEVCAQRYAVLSEGKYGVALLNDCKYGYSCRGSTLSLSLLRAPKAPDANCDMGNHRW